MLIRRVGDDIVVDRADDEILVSAEVLSNPDLRFLSVVLDVMTVTASNGTWRYRICEFDTRGNHYTCRRLRDDQ